MDPSPAWGWILRTPRENGGDLTGALPESSLGDPRVGPLFLGLRKSRSSWCGGEGPRVCRREGPEGKQKNCVAILEAKGQGICCVELLWGCCEVKEVETVELLSVASIGGGVYRIGSGVAFPGRAYSSQAQHFPLCPTQVMKSEHSLPKTLEGRVPFPQLGEKTSQKLGPQYVPILVKRFTSSGPNASRNQEQLKLQNQEQLRRESSQATGELSKNKSEILSLGSGGSPHYESRSISPLAIVFHFSSEVILIKLICMSIYRWSIKEPEVPPMLQGACGWQGLIMEEEINCRAKLISQHNRWIKREPADCCFPCQSMRRTLKLQLQTIIIFGCKRSHE